jgi:alginate O-acetyltransferase complex protein AlgI
VGAGLPRTIAATALPLGISFFTFTQIGFLVDAWRGSAREYRFMNYLLFVSYFPHLIAGPILHHAEMMPQLEREAAGGERAREVAAGLALFAIGLFKKVVIADGVGAYVAPVFDAPASGVALTAFDAWGGALAYAMQLYFDFSGYSDMALGVSLMFGIRLPLNFDSPYKAASLIEFWRRWHMTLARFLREYLYVPLGGNRRGEPRRYVNIMVTMVLGGVWHGAGWTFALWGAYHGLLLCINHAWREFLHARGRRADAMPRLLGVALTFLAVLAGWVLFRAASPADALAILRAMTMVHESGGSRVLGLAVVPWLLLGSIVVWGLPNAYQVLASARPALSAPRDGPARIQWRPALPWAAFATVLLVAVLSRMHAQSTFLYFQF